MPFKIIKHTIITFTFLFLFFGLLNAQDTTHKKQDTLYYRFTYQQEFEHFNEPVFTAVDTSLNLFQRYEQLSSCAFLGNSGKAYKNLLFETPFKQGFNLGENVYRQYFPEKDKLLYYDVSSPYSDLYYVMGGNKEQIFKVVHTQNINKLFNLALNFNIISSPGSYRRQKTDISNFIITSNYRSKNKKYTLLGNIRAYKWYNNENGGLADISDFTTQLLTRTDLFDVNLNSAQNRVKENSIFLRQEIGFFKTQLTDSTSITDKSLYNTRLSHTFNYMLNSFTYIDENPSPTYYQNVFFDTLYTGDSTHLKLMSNELSLSQVFIRNKNKEPIFFADLALEHQYVGHNQFITYLIDSLIPVKQDKQYISQYITKAAVHIKLSPNFNTALHAFNVIDGYNNEDWGTGLISSITVNNKHTFLINASLNNYVPDYHLNKYISNHFVWNNNFNKTSQLDAGIMYALNGFKAGINMQQLSHWVYIDTDTLPAQYNGNIQLMRISLSKTFTWKQFSLYNSVHLQYSSTEQIYPLPFFVNSHSFYWSTHLFKKALYAQTGIDIYYNSAFKGHAYMPALRQFYVQNNTITGNYPFFDVFINLRIKRANIFAKLTHLNQGFMGYTYYNVPGYPLQGRAFKLGISWKFYD